MQCIVSSGSDVVAKNCCVVVVDGIAATAENGSAICIDGIATTACDGTVLETCGDGVLLTTEDGTVVGSGSYELLLAGYGVWCCHCFTTFFFDVKIKCGFWVSHTCAATI